MDLIMKDIFAEVASGQQSRNARSDRQSSSSSTLTLSSILDANKEFPTLQSPPDSDTGSSEHSCGTNGSQQMSPEYDTDTPPAANGASTAGSLLCLWSGISPTEPLLTDADLKFCKDGTSLGDLTHLSGGYDTSSSSSTSRASSTVTMLHRSVTSNTLSTGKPYQLSHQGASSSPAAQHSASSCHSHQHLLASPPEGVGGGTVPPCKVYSPRLEKCRSALKSISSPNFTLLKLQKALSHTSLILGGNKPRKGSLSSSTLDLSKPMPSSASTTSCPSAGYSGAAQMNHSASSTLSGCASPSLSHSCSSGSAAAGKARNLASMRLRLSLPNRCMACGSLVAQDRIQCKGYIFHRDCFKCSSMAQNGTRENDMATVIW